MRLFKTVFHVSSIVLATMAVAFAGYGILIQEVSFTSIATLQTTTMPIWQALLTTFGGWLILLAIVVIPGGLALALHLRARYHPERRRGLDSLRNYQPRPA
jgi:glucan phosphoethanolaminetransferase (alkaline phosphatase superfamily)